MDLKELLKSDFDASLEQAKQAAGNTLFSFLGTSLQTKAENAGLQLKNEFVPKAAEPEVGQSLAGFEMPSVSTGLMIGGALLLGYIIFKKKAGK